MKCYTNLEQSRKLVEILSIKSADMCYEVGEDLDGYITKTIYTPLMHTPYNDDYIPCWSLAALLEVLPDSKICHYNDRYYCQQMSEGDEFTRYSTAEYDNPIDACVELILKLHEQKSDTDKTEQKFHEGDWIIHKDNKHIPIKIIGKIGMYYKIVDTVNYHHNILIYCINENYRLWTIQDAKDGDVLVTSGCILIFEKYLPKDGGVSYCHYDCVSSTPQFDFTKDYNWYFGKEAEVYPATKEQRDFLFQKMKETGYEWDAEKKELKKPAWSEED